MVILKNEENEETTEFEFSECKKDKIIVEGLTEGQYIYCENPYYYQDENGYMIGLDNRFTEFKVMNSDHEVVKLISVNWIVLCDEEIECMQSAEIEQSEVKYKDDSMEYNYFILLVLIFFVIVIWQRKIQRHE